MNGINLLSYQIDKTTTFKLQDACFINIGDACTYFIKYDKPQLRSLAPKLTL